MGVFVCGFVQNDPSGWWRYLYRDTFSALCLPRSPLLCVKDGMFCRKITVTWYISNTKTCSCGFISGRLSFWLYLGKLFNTSALQFRWG